MITYYFLFLVLLCYAFVELRDYELNRFSKVFIVLLLVAISGFRFEVGDDYNNYLPIFKYPDDYSLEPGFLLIVYFVKSIGLSPQAAFFLTSVLVIVPLAWFINKIIPQYFVTGLSTYVFTFIYFEGMNTIRQAIAMTIMLIAICSFIQNRQRLSFILMVLFAACFHASAMVIGILAWFVIVYSTEDLNERFFFLSLVFSFIAGFFILSFVDLLANLSSVFGYANYLNYLEQRGVNSGIFHYFLNVFACYILLFSYFKKEFLSFFEKSVIKMVLVSVILYNFFFNFYIGLRLYWYFYLFMVFLLPTVMKYLEKRVRFLSYSMLICIFIAYTIISLGTDFYSNYRYSLNMIGE